VASGALDSRFDGRAFDSRPPRLVLGWVTVFGRANHLGIPPSYPGKLSLVPYAGREMSTGQSAAMLCGWRVMAGWPIPLGRGVNAWVAGKMFDPSLTRAIPERLRDHYRYVHNTKRYTNVLFT